jgi:peptide/nickel transport system substrate-binding protein
MRPAADAAAARDLLRQAGYPEGFTVAFDCVSATVRAAACQAMAAMLDKVGIHARLQLSPSATFFPKLTQATTPLAEFGWSPNTDPWNVLHSLLHTHDGVTAGAFNAGRYTNPRLDALIDAIRVEPDLAIRRAKVAQALALVREEMPLVPLYRRHHVWVMRREVSVVQWPSDYTELRWAAMRPR